MIISFSQFIDHFPMRTPLLENYQLPCLVTPEGTTHPSDWCIQTFSTGGGAQSSWSTCNLDSLPEYMFKLLSYSTQQETTGKPPLSAKSQWISGFPKAMAQWLLVYETTQWLPEISRLKSWSWAILARARRSSISIRPGQVAAGSVVCLSNGLWLVEWAQPSLEELLTLMNLTVSDHHASTATNYNCYQLQVVVDSDFWWGNATSTLGAYHHRFAFGTWLKCMDQWIDWKNWGTENPSFPGGERNINAFDHLHNHQGILNIYEHGPPTMANIPENWQDMSGMPAQSQPSNIIPMRAKRRKQGQTQKALGSGTS